MGWVSPTGNDNPDAWHDEANAYDEDTGTFAYCSVIDNYIELTLGSAIDCNKVQIYAGDYLGFPPSHDDPDLAIDLHYDSAWHNIFSGTITKTTWVEKTNAAGTKSVDKARVKANSIANDSLRLYEFDFWEVAGVTHEGAATLAGVGTLAGIGRGIFIGKSTLSGTGTLASIGRGIFVGKSTFSGTGTLATIGSFLRFGKVSLSGAGTLRGIGRLIAIGKSTFAGTGTLSVMGRRFWAVALTLRAHSWDLTLKGED